MFESGKGDGLGYESAVRSFHASANKIFTVGTVYIEFQISVGTVVGYGNSVVNGHTLFKYEHKVVFIAGFTDRRIERN